MQHRQIHSATSSFEQISYVKEDWSTLFDIGRRVSRSVDTREACVKWVKVYFTQRLYLPLLLPETDLNWMTLFSFLLFFRVGRGLTKWTIVRDLRKSSETLRALLKSKFDLYFVSSSTMYNSGAELSEKILVMNSTEIDFERKALFFRV